jgi:hypothetical protein
MQAVNFCPRILTGARAFYDGSDSMGPLAAKGVVLYVDCAQPNHALYQKTLTDLMDAYHAVPGTSTINLLAQPSYESVPLEILKYQRSTIRSVPTPSSRRSRVWDRAPSSGSANMTTRRPTTSG